MNDNFIYFINNLYMSKRLSESFSELSLQNTTPDVVYYMLGRFQPFHDGHKQLFQRALAKHGQVAIMVRDMPISESNPWKPEDICENIEQELYEYAGKFRCYPVPNIMNITYGRGVGYKIEEEVLDEETQKISATKIREQMRKDGEL